MITTQLADLPKTEVVERLEAVKVPVGPIHTVGEALGSDQAKARGTVVEVAHPDVQGGYVKLLANPLKLSRTPVRYRSAPPRFGQDTDEILATLSKDDSAD
jgi:formyl-CoA transferase